MFRPLVVWTGFAGAAVAIAFTDGTVSAVGVASCLALVALIVASRRSAPGSTASRVLLVANGCGVLAFFAHVLPGFRDLVLLRESVLSPGAYPTSILWGFDKPFAGFLLLGSAVARARTWPEWRDIFMPTFLLLLGGSVVLGGGGVVLHALRWAPHWTPVSALFVVGNLFFVCIPEEALFRGVVQRFLQEKFPRDARGRAGAVLLSAVLFGLCHFAGGLGLMLSATVAGVFYSAAYAWTGRIESAILVHAGINIAHFTLFSYPALVWHQ